jgi:osmotically-inducible protein OsmY
MKRLSILFVAFLVIASACKPKDEDLTKAIQTAIASVSSDVAVTTQDGVATLTGEVENEEIIQQVLTLAQGTKGIKSVVNNMTVKVAEIVFSADDVLKQKVEEGFAKYGVTGITATVVNGEVVLTGDITRDKLMDAMKAANEALPTKVKNELTIK